MSTAYDAGARPAARAYVRRRGHLPLAAVLSTGFLGALAIALAGAGGGSPHDPRGLWFGGDTPLGSSDHGGAAPVLTVAGLLLLVASWLVLGLLVARRYAGVRTVAVAAVLVALPLLAAPPLFSDDAGTYVAVGQLVHSGLDPYQVGWGILGRADYAHTNASFWAGSPSPYSPGFLRLLQLVAVLTHGSPYAGTLLLRALAVLALAASAVLLVRLLPVGSELRAQALWLAIANPLVLIGALSGAHNDALIVVPLLGALLAHRSRQPVLALVLVGLAGQVKVTGLLAASVLAADLALRQSGRARQLGAWVGGCALSAATFSAVTLASGLGWGWVGALSVPGRANTSATPLDAGWDVLVRLSVVAADQDPQVVNTAPGWLISVGLAVGLAVTLALSARVRRVGVARGIALSLAAVLLLGGAFWPWYLLVPLALLAVGGEAVERSVAAGLSVLLLFAGRAGGLPRLDTHPFATDLIFLGCYAIAVAAVVLPQPRLAARAIVGRLTAA